MESVQGQDLMSRNCGKDPQFLIPSKQICSKGGIPAVYVHPPGGGVGVCFGECSGGGGGSGGGSSGGGEGRSTPPRPCPPRWLLVGGLLLSLVLLTSVVVCFWQLYALQTRVQGLQDQLARCVCGVEAPVRAGHPDGEASTAAAQSAQTRRLSSTQRQKETEICKEDNMYNVTGRRDVGRKMQRGRRAIIRITPAVRYFVRNKLKKKFDKLEEKVETTLRDLNTSLNRQLRRYQADFVIQKETEVCKEDNMYNVTGGRDVGRKMQRGRRAIIRITPAVRYFVRNKLKEKFDKLEEKLETTLRDMNTSLNRQLRRYQADFVIQKLKKLDTKITTTQRELNTSWHREFRRHQESLTLHPTSVHLQAIHMYAYVNTSDKDRRKLEGINPPAIDVKTGNLTKYGLRPQKNSTTYTFWKIASWFKHCILSPESAFHFPCDSPGSKVSILRSGVYFIYVHITYQDDSLRAEFNLLASPTAEGRRAQRHLVNCVNSIRPKRIRDRMYRTCDVSTLQRLNAGDDIRIDKANPQDIEVYIAGFGNNHPKPAETSFWGMVQISADNDK